MYPVLPLKTNEMKYHSFRFIIGDVWINELDEFLKITPCIWENGPVIDNKTLSLPASLPKSKNKKRNERVNVKRIFAVDTASLGTQVTIYE